MGTEEGGRGGGRHAQRQMAGSLHQQVSWQLESRKNIKTKSTEQRSVKKRPADANYRRRCRRRLLKQASGLATGSADGAKDLVVRRYAKPDTARTTKTPPGRSRPVARTQNRNTPSPVQQSRSQSNGGVARATYVLVALRDSAPAIARRTLTLSCAALASTDLTTARAMSATLPSAESGPGTACNPADDKRPSDIRVRK